LKLNLGGNEQFEGGEGSSPLVGFTHADIRKIEGVELVCDVSTHVPVEDESVEEIRASHIIEHIHPDKVDAAIGEWRRILIPSGLLRVYCPDAEKIAKAYTMGQITIERFSALIFGAQSYENQPGIEKSDDDLAELVNLHRAAYDKERLTILLEMNGFKIVGNEPRENAYYFDLGVQGVKV